ncbi:hypothetical protein QP944_10795 [Corynebacterium sp. MSK105]|uniref:hypothetical protein n=1 Tax=unclassified Corynebacterium TaxID=2624378 RepID=UPI001EF69141|nr:MULTISPECIES: hypothetical protein [unclassified Corynebacterium]MCG7446009.1 hypothetical protein [Corynebacterium sp. ACRPO]MDK8483598.1 hypothetical protein [Corynebacterium sp. MSK074]MDK8691016.1 hypothetical protein [Corynebacterium sp. MSK105]
MNNLEGTVSHAGSTKQRLLEQSARILAKGGCDALKVCAVAEQIAVPVDEAKSFFEDDHDLFIQTSRFLDERLRVASYEALDNLPDDATAIQKLCESAKVYFNLAVDNPTYFAAYNNGETATSFPNFEDGIEEAKSFDAFPPAFRWMLEHMREAAIAARGDFDHRLVVIQTLTFLSELQGITHLATFGIMRHLSPTAKKQTFNACIETLFSGLEDSLRDGEIAPFEPLALVGGPAEPFTTAAKDMPKSTAEEKRAAIFRGAAEEIVYNGLPSLHLGSAAARAGVDLADAEHLFDGNSHLLRSLEESLDEANTLAIMRQNQAVPEGSHGLDYIKATGFGYLEYALEDPVGFVALIEVSSRSIVPVSFEESGDTEQPFDMGKAFTYIMNLVRDAISESNGPRSPWILFTQIAALWASIHGLSQLSTVGALRYHSADFYFNLASKVMDVVIQGMVNVLELKQPE